MRRYVFILWAFVRGIYLSIRLLLRPQELDTLLKLANVMAELPAFQAAVEYAKKDLQVKSLIESRYSPGLPSMEVLKNYPDGTLGKAYYQHMNFHKLDPYYPPPLQNVSEKIYYRERQREIHDILHAILNIGVQVEDEAKLNAFFMVKGASPFTTVIVAGSFFHFLLKKPSELIHLTKLVREGFELGENLKSPFAIRWEEYLDRPIEEAKQAIGYRGDIIC